MRLFRPTFAAGALVVLASTAACTQVRSHQGYVFDADLANSVQVGVDNRQSVLATLGKPSFGSQFNKGDWYYIARDNRSLAFRNPRPVDQVTLQISFDQAGNVSAIRRSGKELVAAVTPTSRKTPTLGRGRGFFKDLFGNIGTVGAPGASGGPGGGRDQP